MTDRTAPAPAFAGVAAAAGGLALLAVCGLLARSGKVPSAERSVFHAVNDLPQWLYRPMWLFQQFGNLNGLARTYVGAHNPLDVLGGAALGVFIGGLLYVGAHVTARRPLAAA